MHHPAQRRTDRCGDQESQGGPQGAAGFFADRQQGGGAGPVEQGEQQHTHRPPGGPALGEEDGQEGAQIQGGQGPLGLVGHQGNGQHDLVGREAQEEGEQQHPIQAQGVAQRVQGC